MAYYIGGNRNVVQNRRIQGQSLMGAEYPGSARMRGMGWNPYAGEESISEMPGLNDSEQEDMKRWNQENVQGEQSIWNTQPSGNRNGQPYMRCSYLDILEEEERVEKDLRRLQSMYPQAAREILPMVEDVCDRMEYEGSMMFDESPDRNTVRRLSSDIYRKIREQYPEGIQPVQRDEVLSMQYPGPGLPPGSNPAPGPGRSSAPNPGPAPDPDGSFLNNLVQVMLIQEMHRRRCRYNRCRPQNYV